jgi:transposase
MKGFQMPRYKPVDRGPMLLPVVLEEQIQPGTFEFALDRLVDTELDLSALDAKFNYDEVGASAYDPRVMLKSVLLGYSRGLISSRRMEQACQDDVVFTAISGDSRPSYTHIAKFVRSPGPDIHTLFTQAPQRAHAHGDRLGPRATAVQPAHRHGRAGVRQHPATQEDGPLHAANQGEGARLTHQGPSGATCVPKRSENAADTSTNDRRRGAKDESAQKTGYCTVSLGGEFQLQFALSGRDV